MPDAVAGRRVSFTALSVLATCARRFHLEHERGLHGRPEAVVARPGAPGAAPSAWGGTALGDLVHRALAEVDWSGPAPAPGWAAAAARAAGLPDSARDRQRAERLVAEALGSPLAGRIRAGRARAEEPFAVEVGGAVLAGAIDLLVDEGGGRALVVDWKTHALGPGVTAAAVAEDHRLQQALYGLAALRAGWSEVTLTWAVLEDLAASPARSVGPADAAALEAELLEALAPLRAPGAPRGRADAPAVLQRLSRARRDVPGGPRLALTREAGPRGCDMIGIVRTPLLERI